MGIDIYLRWRKQTKAEKEAQIKCGFSTTSGHLGYLREAYHGGPYATRLLVREAFEAKKCRAMIPAEVMLERLTHVTEPAMGKNMGHMMAEMIVNHLGLHFGEAAGAADTLNQIKSGETTPMTVEEAVQMRCERLYPEGGKKHAQEVLQSFRNFVLLAARKEKETGQPCIVYASY